MIHGDPAEISGSDREIRRWLEDHLFDAVPVSVCVVDRTFRILKANRRFGETFGPWRDRRCHAVYKGQDRPCARCAAVETFADGRIRSREEVAPGRDGRPEHYLVQMVPLCRPDGTIPFLIEMSTDISPIKALEREKLEAERLAAVGETVAGIAHGVKNVLMGLEGGVYVVNSGIERGDDARIAQGWTMIQSNIAKISKFVKEFLQFARGRTPRVALTDPAAPVREVVTLYRERAAMEGVAIETSVQEDLAPAALDEEAIQSCLANLVSNAVDACTMSDAKRDFRVEVRLEERDGILTYEVSDNGCGIDAELSRKIFTNFFSTKETGKGTGLGLLMTRKIVHEHGGRVDFDSEAGRGATFRMRFPRARLPRAEAPEEGEPA